MCAHCGCDQPANRHGDARSVTVGDLRQAMKTASHREGGKGLAATGREVARMLRKHGRRRKRN